MRINNTLTEQRKDLVKNMLIADRNMTISELQEALMVRYNHKMNNNTLHKLRTQVLDDIFNPKTLSRHWEEFDPASMLSPIAPGFELVKFTKEQKRIQTQAKILMAFKDDPKAYNKDVAKKLGIGTTILNTYLQFFKKHDIIEIKKRIINRRLIRVVIVKVLEDAIPKSEIG